MRPTLTNSNLPLCQTPCQAPLPGFTPVPAEYPLSPYLSLSILNNKRNTRDTRQGHYVQMLKPLPRPGLLLKSFERLYPILCKLLGSPNRAEMTKKALLLQALTGKCFASARYLAGAGFSSEKTWDRCLAYLKSKGWAETARTRRPNGYDSVNLIDLRELWKLLIKILTSTAHRFQVVKSQLWVKIHGAWAPVVQLQVPVVSSS